jgi:hypothetical protein
MSDNTIYVAIASYKDTRLLDTIVNMLETAKYPENIYIGIVEQEDEDKRLVIREEWRDTIRYIGINPKESRGCCWARSLTNTLYRGEKWHLQIDAHMLFGQDWDLWMINTLAAMQHVNPKSILSAFPTAFYIKEGQVVLEAINVGVNAGAVKANSTFEPNSYLLHNEPGYVISGAPIRGFMLLAGFIFTSGNWVQEIPYDPNFYFSGEEQGLAIRSYTHGWDIFNPPAAPIYHLYDNVEAPSSERRSRPENPQYDAVAHEKTASLIQMADKRLSRLIEGEDLGIYSLGKVRTLEEYEAFSGIDYKAKTVSPKAWSNYKRIGND